eukprot:UN30630
MSFYFNPKAEAYPYGPKDAILGESIALFLGLFIVTLLPQLICYYAADLPNNSDTVRGEAWFMLCPVSTIAVVYAILEYTDRSDVRQKLSAKRRTERKKEEMEFEEESPSIRTRERTYSDPWKELGEETAPPDRRLMVCLLCPVCLGVSSIVFVPGFMRIHDDRAFDGGSGEGLFIMVP